MYTYFKVRNFRCFQELELDDLALVNLIAGMNNVGKTALLEAMFLHGGAYNPEITLRLNAFRGIEMVDLTLGSWVEHPLSSFFNQFDVSKTIDLEGEDTVTGHRSLRLRAVGEPSGPVEVHQGGASILDEFSIGYVEDESKGVLSTSEVAKVLELEYKEEAADPKIYRMIMDGKRIHVEPLPPAPAFQTFFQGARMRIPLTQQAIRYGKLELHGEQERVLRVLHIIEPRLQGVKSVAIADRSSILHGDIGTDRLMPLPIMGEGLVRLADLAVNIGNAPNGVVLVDEIENGLHHSIIFKVWKAIASEARKSNTQVFATTHSWECIRAAHEAFASEEEYNFRLHRLDGMNGEITAVTYDQESLAASLKHGMEVR